MTAVYFWGRARDLRWSVICRFRRKLSCQPHMNLSLPQMPTCLPWSEANIRESHRTAIYSMMRGEGRTPPVTI